MFNNKKNLQLEIDKAKLEERNSFLQTRVEFLESETERLARSFEHEREFWKDQLNQALAAASTAGPGASLQSLAEDAQAEMNDEEIKALQKKTAEFWDDWQYWHGGDSNIRMIAPSSEGVVENATTDSA